MRDVFVGRQQELAFLTSLLERARTGAAGVVFAEGVAGMGKTALVSRLLRVAGDVRLVRAAGEEFEQGLPFGVVDQLRSDAGAGAEAGAAGGASDRAADARAAAPDVLAVGAELFALVDGLQQAGPVVLVVDDAQWVDEPSLRVLAFVFRRLRAHRVLAVVVTRDRVAERLPESLHRVMVSDIGARVTLPGLSAEELAELAVSVGAGPLPGRAAARLREHTRGSPLHARALFEELPPGVQWDAGQPLPAPRSFAMLVLARLARCSAATERLVVATAVLGGAAPVDLVAQLADVAEPLAALDEAVAARLLEERPGPTGWRVAFGHPLLQAAVYGDLGPARRSALHERAAALVREEPAALRHRVAAAALPDATLAHEVAAQARAVAGTSLSAAADALAAAATLSPAGAERERHLLDAVELMVLSGRAAEAAALAPTLRGFAAGARRELVFGGLALATESAAAAAEQLATAWRVCDPAAEPDVAARIAVQLAGAARLGGDATGAVSWARRATAADPAAAARLHATDALLLALGAGGRIDEALGLAEPPPACPGPPAGDAGPLPLDGMVGRGIVRLWSGAAALARDELAAALERYARRGAGPVQYLVTALGGLAEAEYRLGAWDDAVHHAGEAIAVATEAGHRTMLGPLHAVAVLPHARRGDWGFAESHLAAAAELAAAAPDATTVGWAGSAASVLAASRPDPAGVLAAVKPVLDLLPCETLDSVGILPWHEPYLDALIETGRIAQAARLLATCQAQAQHRNDPVLLLTLARLSGKLLAAQGEPGVADEAYAAALAGADACPDPFERAQLELEYGGLLRRQGRRGRAAVVLRAARDRLAGLGAAPYLERCDRELRTCGLGQRADAAGQQLTSQERAVADLVADGRSNRDVARELVVSVKTIEFHLGNVFSKLGVRSRSQLTLELLKARGAA
jgi:DNA-binding CsgD family transcriptional regulator